MAKINMKKLYGLRRELEEHLETLGADSYASGTDRATKEVDFSFDLNGLVYSVHIKELTK